MNYKNVEMRDFVADDGIKDKTETDEESHERNEMNDENLEIRDFAVDDGIEDKTESDEENHERSDDSKDNDDREFCVDEDNIIPDVEVNMRDFYMNIDLEAEFLEKRLSKHRDNESDEVIEELDVINNDQWDSLDEGFDIERKRRVIIKELGKETRFSQGERHKVTFRIGQKYISKKKLNEKIQLHALETRRNIFFMKNNKMRLRVLYKGTVDFNDGQVGELTPCPWVIQGSRDYILELQSTNPDTIVKLEFDSEPNPSATSRSFKRMFVCLGVMKKGFRACMRDFLAFDGAFMKGPFPGQILTTIWGLRAAISQLFPCAEHRAVLDMLLNNLCEVFNRKLIEGRDNPLITCLEYIKEYMMKRICNVRCKTTLNDITNNGEKVGELHTYAHRVQWLETWKTACVYKTGRPKKKRNQSIKEKSQKK
uniref:Uncharacterized protein n=1 Tax=Lactuca sativa TaxID=4236 RepID=A0A9R1WHI6_LACSA|nr:hypothetical protein LSAT_V11C100033830 [Lactuca sativa]